MNTTDLAHRLYYRQPAEHWVEALPIGSGRLGAMIWGEPCLEHIPLNEDTLWSGYPRETDLSVDTAQLDECRRLVANHQFLRAQEQIETHMLGSFTDSYMPAGNLHLEFFDLGDISEYQRELDLHTASAILILFGNTLPPILIRASLSVSQRIVLGRFICAFPLTPRSDTRFTQKGAALWRICVVPLMWSPVIFMTRKNRSSGKAQKDIWACALA